MHRPDWQLSVWVHASPSEQEVPLAAGGLLQVPLVGLQVPATWHWSNAVQVTGLVPVHTPDWQLSLCVQTSPSEHAVPFAAAGLLHVPFAGLQVPAT